MEAGGRHDVQGQQGGRRGRLHREGDGVAQAFQGGGDGAGPFLGGVVQARDRVHDAAGGGPGRVDGLGAVVRVRARGVEIEGVARLQGEAGRPRDGDALKGGDRVHDDDGVRVHDDVLGNGRPPRRDQQEGRHRRARHGFDRVPHLHAPYIKKNRVTENPLQVNRKGLHFR